MFVFVLAVTSLVAGVVAAISGFGIGSLITPVFAFQTGTKLAVAAVAIPHFVATAVRLALMWRDVDRELLIRFGLLSAIGGLAGALLQTTLGSRVLTAIFAGLLLFAGISELAGQGNRIRISSRLTTVAGITSGVLGGLVGNQGGIRSAAMLGFGLSRKSFVATATAVGMLVDVVRLPIYLSTSASELEPYIHWIAIATGLAVAGTFVGRFLLDRIPDKTYRKIVAVTITMLGIYMAIEGIRG